MKSLSPRLASAYLRRRVKRGFEAATSLRDARRVFDLQLPHAEPAGGFRPERIGGVAGEWAGEGGATLLYLHGGAFFAGSPRHYRPIACAFASLGFKRVHAGLSAGAAPSLSGGAGRRAGGLRGAGRARRHRDRRRFGRRRPRSVADDFAARRRPAAPRRRGFVFALDRSRRHRRLGARKRGERPAVLAPHVEKRRARLSRGREFQKSAGLAAYTAICAACRRCCCTRARANCCATTPCGSRRARSRRASRRASRYGRMRRIAGNWRRR